MSCFNAEGDNTNSRPTICGVELKGKNSTNLKTHLNSCHKEVFGEVAKRDTNRKQAQIGKRKSVQSTSVSSGSQQTLASCFKRAEVWGIGSVEYSKREDALVSLFVETGLPTRLCEQPAFKKFCGVLDPKFKVPGSGRVTSQLAQRMDSATTLVKQMLQTTRKVTLCIDGWSKKGLTASYMGISACFYNPSAKEAQHVFINLHRISHPHTGEVIAKCIEHTLTTWDITEEKVLLIVTDNGANIVKAIKILAQSGKVCEATEKAVEYAENSEDEPDDSDASSTDQGSDTGK